MRGVGIFFLESLYGLMYLLAAVPHAENLDLPPVVHVSEPTDEVNCAGKSGSISDCRLRVAKHFQSWRLSVWIAS